MNRLLQHFVDSNTDSNHASASHSTVPVPPQSLGGSYHGKTHGSYQRTTPNGPFYYQPSSAPLFSANGLDEIPLTSESSGKTYETVDLNTEITHHHHNEQLGTFNKRVHFDTSKGSSCQSGDTVKFASSDRFSASPNFVNHFQNSYHTQSKSQNLSRLHGTQEQNTTIISPFSVSEATQSGQSVMENDPFAAPVDSRDDDVQIMRRNDPFTMNLVEKKHVERKELLETRNNMKEESEFTQPLQDEARYECDQERLQEPSSFVGVDLFAASTPCQYSTTTNVLEASTTMNDEQIPSADSLFGSSSSSTMNEDWMHSFGRRSSQPAPRSMETQKVLSREEPSASSLFGSDALTTSQSVSAGLRTHASSLPPMSEVDVSPSSVKSQAGILPSPAKSQTNYLRPPIKPPVGSSSSTRNNATTVPMRPPVTSSSFSVIRPGDDHHNASSSMKLSILTKPTLKSGLDMRHMKSPAGKRDDDAMSNTPSIAPSWMSMRSTLDDSLKLSDIYKQMTTRLEGEKHDLLKVVASQAQEIAQMKKHIASLELQLKKYRAHDF